jgi:hypothetical protein
VNWFEGAIKVSLRQMVASVFVDWRCYASGAESTLNETSGFSRLFSFIHPDREDDPKLVWALCPTDYSYALRWSLPRVQVRKAACEWCQIRHKDNKNNNNNNK